VDDGVNMTAARRVIARASARIRAREADPGAIAREALQEPLPEEARSAASAAVEDALALRRELDEAHLARETLLAGVAHDLRNPLNTFAMSAGLLEDDFARDDVDLRRGQSLLARMRRGIERMRKIVDELIEASLIEAGKVEIARALELAAQLVRGAMAASEPVLQERGGAVVEGQIDPDARVVVDRARAVQALAHAIAFTVRACGEGGVIHVSASREEGAVVFMAAATPRSAIVTPSHDGRGGLALAIARGLVRLHGGSFDSEIGARVAVRFTLPAAS
jgi:signal transduction histidine kinase